MAEIIYENDSGLLVVQRLEEVTNKAAADVAGIMGDAYAHQFEGDGTQAGLLEGTFKNGPFDPDDPQRTGDIRNRMEQHISRYGSEYWFARIVTVDSSEESAPVGLIKVSPSRPSRLCPWITNLFVNDIVVRPEYQKPSETSEDEEDTAPHIGSSLLHGMTKFSKLHRQTGPVVLDAYEQNSKVNQWFEGLGFTRQPNRVDPYELPDNQRLDQVRMEAPSGKEVTRRLEAKIPRLSTATYRA